MADDSTQFAQPVGTGFIMLKDATATGGNHFVRADHISAIRPVWNSHNEWIGCRVFTLDGTDRTVNASFEQITAAIELELTRTFNRPNNQYIKLSRPGQFSHLLEVCQARNVHGSAVVAADGIKAGPPVDRSFATGRALNDLLWRHRDDICALIYRANQGGQSNG